MVSAEYRRRMPEDSVLYRVVQRHLETFLVMADARGEEGRALPKYVRQEFYRFLDCGVLARGFQRVRCGGCGYEGVVAFS